MKPNTLPHRFGKLGLMVLALAVLPAAPTKAALVVYDDFTVPAAGTVNPALWSTVTGGVLPTQSGGVATFDSTGGTPFVRSTQTFNHGTFRFTMTGYTDSGANYTNGGHLFGLESQSGNTLAADNAIFLRDDGGKVLYKNGVGQLPAMPAYEPTSLPVDYTFVWKPNLVEIYRDTALLFSTTDQSIIPTGPMRFSMGAYTNAGVQTFAFDKVAYEAAPIVQFRMQETNPGHVVTAADSSGYGNHGTYLHAFGGPGFFSNTNDHPNPAINPGKQFNVDPGTGRGVHIALDPSAASIAGRSSNFSFEFLIKPQADTFTSGLLAIYANDGGFEPGDIHLNINGGNIELAVSGNPVHASANLQSQAGLGEWSHVAVTYDGGLTSFYLDGVLIGSGITAGMAGNLHESANIGAWFNASTSRFFRGALDEFSIYNVTLTADQVRERAALLSAAVPEPALLPLDLCVIAGAMRRRRSAC